LNNQGNNSYAFFKDLVYSNGRMTDSINKKLHAHDRMLQNINTKLDEFSSVLKNQLSFNKMIETQLAQIAAAIPSYEKDKIPGKPEGTMVQPTLLRQGMTSLRMVGDFLLRKVILGTPSLLVP
jgi:hypothetical protein